MDRFTASFAATSCLEVVEVITSPEFAQRFAAELEVDEHRSRLSGPAGRLEHELLLTFSTRRIPRPFNRVVPPRVTVRWLTAWTPGEHGTYRSSYSASSAHPSASCTGTSTLTPGDGQVAWELVGRIAAQRSGVLPSKAIEKGLGSLLLAVLSDEVAVANRMLARP